MFFSNDGTVDEDSYNANLLSSYAYSVLLHFKALKTQLRLRSLLALQSRKRKVYSKPQRLEAEKRFEARKTVISR